MTEKAPYGLKMVTGGYSKAEIQAAANRVKIGDKIRYKAVREKTNVTDWKTGTVTGKYPYFCLLDNGYSKDTVLWVDMI